MPIRSSCIAHAKQLVLQGLPISSVAAEVGFFDLSHFSRDFKRYIGITPGAYALNRKDMHYDQPHPAYPTA